jgi:hypothetical protein
MNMTRFRMVLTLSRSNSPTSSFTILCCGLLLSLFFTCPRCITGCYFYSHENCFKDISSFRLCYNLNKHTSDQDSIFRLRPASSAVVVIGPPVRMNIYGIVMKHTRANKKREKKPKVKKKVKKGQ